MTNEQTSAEPRVSWLAIGSLGVGAFALVTSEFLPMGLLPDIARDIGSTNGQTGLMVTMPGVLAAIAAPLSMHYARGIERRRILLVLLALLVVSNVMVAFAGSFPVLMIGRALLGLAIGGFWTIAGALGPRLRPGPEGVRATAVIFSGVSLGTVLGLPAGSFLGDLFGWRYAFGTSAALAMVAMSAVAALLPKVPAEKTAGLRDMLAIMRDARGRVLILAASIMYAGTYGAYTYIAPFLSEKAGISGGILSAVLLASGGAGFLGNMFGGWIAGRDVRTAVLVNTGIGTLSIGLLCVSGGKSVIAIGLVTAWGFSLGMQAIAMQSWMLEGALGRRDAMQALFVSLTQLAIGVGALTCGVFVDHAGTTGAMIEGAIASAATFAIAVGLTRFARGTIAGKNRTKEICLA